MWKCKVGCIIAILSLVIIEIARSQQSYSDDNDSMENYSDERYNLNDNDALEQSQQELELKGLLSQELINANTIEHEAPAQQIKNPKQTKNTKNTKNNNLKSAKYDDDEDENHNGNEQNGSDEDEQFEYNPWKHSFYEQFADGTYVFGYMLPSGVTRYERSFYSEEYKGLVIEGFHTEPRIYGKHKLYELRCYRSDTYGHRPLPVQYLSRPPIVERDSKPNVNCFDK
ncbi:uncharacterized protein LOC119675982 [Teleopsis dalmanni]|uniref:uncharacterized protein LOC119675982 n=1 Tax=Teleopsis dalmanni TaxID=139649 RepID=UPI0018CE3716|nr:uncharacterized protein LOC119675982 [Teleopsis dalmanni]